MGKAQSCLPLKAASPNASDTHRAGLEQAGGFRDAGRMAGLVAAGLQAGVIILPPPAKRPSQRL